MRGVRDDSMPHEDDRLRFKSFETQYCGFDELTSFTYAQYIYMFSRLRSSTGLPCVMRSATNPGDIGHEWVLHRWAPWLYPDPAKEPDRARPDEYAGPFQLPGHRLHYRRAHDNDTEETLCKPGDKGAYSRAFFPAAIADNPSIAVNDPEYVTRLKMLSRLERKQLLGGDWMAKADPGEFFDRTWFDIVARGPATLAVCRVRYWDRAGTAAPGKPVTTGPAWTSWLLYATDVHGFGYVEDVIRFRGEPHEVEKRIVDAARRDKRDHGDVMVCLERDPGQAGKFEVQHYIRKSLQGYNVRAVPPQGNKVYRAKPVSAQAEQRNIRVVRADWNRPFFDELESFPNGYKDQVDSLSGAYAVTLGGGGRAHVGGGDPTSPSADAGGY